MPYIIAVIWSLRGLSKPTKGSSTPAAIIVRIFLEDTRVLPEEPLRNFRRKPLDYLASERSQANVLLRFLRGISQRLEVRNYLLSLACLQFHCPILRRPRSNF